MDIRSTAYFEAYDIMTTIIIFRHICPVVQYEIFTSIRKTAKNNVISQHNSINKIRKMNVKLVNGNESLS